MSSETTLGLSLESLASRLATPKTSFASLKRKDNSGSIPPSVICVSPTENHLQLDHWFPASHIGSGEEWPPESRVSDGFTRRMPVGLLWDLAQREQPWHIDSDIESDAMPAIARAAADTLRDYETTKSVGLVIPNWLKQAQQQTLLSELAGTGIKWRLTWLPIAAATYWIDRFFHGKNLQAKTRKKIGQIFCLHLGLFGCEYALIELIAEPIDGRTVLLPARQRPPKNSDLQKSHVPGLMSDILLHQAAREPEGSEDHAHAWRRMWVTPWMQRQLANWKGKSFTDSHRECPSPYDPPVINGMLSSNATAVTCDGISWPTIDLKAAKQWVDSILSQLDRANEQLDGAIITGELASVRFKGRTLGEQLVRNHVKPDYISVADDSAPADLLAIGAAEQCRRMDVGEPSFLTKLPWLRTVVSRVGEPEWISLLADDDAYVMGGKLWARPEPVTGLSIPRGKVLTLAIDHEDLNNVRESQIEIPASYKPNQPAELHVAITPGQGNARVELRTAGMKQSRRPVIADLSHMEVYASKEGKPLDPEAYLDDYPRLAPSLVPRLSNLNKWRNVKSEARFMFHSLPSTWIANSIGVVRTALREKYAPPNNSSLQGRNITAIGSDGHPPDNDIDSLSHIVNGCLEILERPNIDNFLRETALRCIAYTSHSSPELERFIAERLIPGHLSDDAELRVVGNCLRSPETIAAFFENCNRHRHAHTLGTHQTRAIAELASYRAEALRYVSESTATRTLRSLMLDFENSNSYGGIDFRYKTMAVAFILRRRIFDESFVPKDSDTAIRLKEKCNHVLNGIRSRRIQVMGGVVNLPAVMRQLIEYIDREGRGPFLWSA